MLTIFTSGTTRALPPCLVLEELALDYDFVNVELRDKVRPAALLKLNPSGRVPVLVDGDIVICQSTAILIYLAERFQRFLPACEPQRSKVLSLLQSVATDIMADHVTLFRALNYNLMSPEVIARTRLSLVNELGRLNERLQSGEYLAGEISIADFHLYTIVGQYDANILAQHGLDAMLRWISTMRARPSVQRVEVKIPYSYDVSNMLR